MKIILINRKYGGSRSVELGRWSRALLSFCCLGLPLGLVGVGYLAGAGQGGEGSALRNISLGKLQDELEQQSSELEGLRQQAQHKLQALTLNLAGLQARMTRLDALGEHLTTMADLEEGEFDFSQPPALGGPLAGEFHVDFTATELGAELVRFDEQLSDRERQLEILESFLTDKYREEQVWLSGQPTQKGWISSGFGRRTDPFTGRQAVHNGIDFAGRKGSDVVAVAAGVVTVAGKRSGYGKLVEISHGDGFVTRYAHNEKNLVEPGEVVRKGQTIALMGSSGRSTGPHVHFEVYKHGRPVDPSSYVRRTRR